MANHLCMCSWFVERKKKRECVGKWSACKPSVQFLFLKAVGWCGNILALLLVVWSVFYLCLVAATTWKDYASGGQWAAFKIFVKHVCLCAQDVVRSLSSLLSNFAPGQPGSCLTAVCNEKGFTGRTKVRIFRLQNVILQKEALTFTVGLHSTSEGSWRGIFVQF